MEGMLDLSHFLEKVSEPAALLGPDGQTVPLPLEIYSVLLDVVDFMRQGKAVTVAPLDQNLTTQEAADFLGMSRPTFVKLLEDGQLPFSRTPGGRHRRVLLRDVVEYQDRMRVDRRRALAKLTAEAYEAGAYNASADDYREALKQARTLNQAD